MLINETRGCGITARHSTRHQLRRCFPIVPRGSRFPNCVQRDVGTRERRELSDAAAVVAATATNGGPSAFSPIRALARTWPSSGESSLHELGTCSAEVRRSTPLNVTARKSRRPKEQRQRPSLPPPPSPSRPSASENGITSRETRLIAVRRLTPYANRGLALDILADAVTLAWQTPTQLLDRN